MSSFVEYSKDPDLLPPECHVCEGPLESPGITCLMCGKQVCRQCGEIGEEIGFACKAHERHETWSVFTMSIAGRSVTRVMRFIWIRSEDEPPRPIIVRTEINGNEDDDHPDWRSGRWIWDHVDHRLNKYLEAYIQSDLIQEPVREEVMPGTQLPTQI